MIPAGTIITEELIDAIRSPKGGFTAKALRAIGVSWPPKHGWRRRAIGFVTKFDIDAPMPSGAGQAPPATPWKPRTPPMLKPEFAGIKVEGVLHFDGACFPNPGPASCGFILRMGAKTVERTTDLGDGTNNVAEYRGLIEGMQCALDNGVTHLEVYGDSQLVIRGVSSRRFSPKNKPHLEKLKREAIDLVDRFAAVDFNWVPREENSEADSLSAHNR